MIFQSRFQYSGSSTKWKYNAEIPIPIAHLTPQRSSTITVPHNLTTVSTQLSLNVLKRNSPVSVIIKNESSLGTGRDGNGRGTLTEMMGGRGSDKNRNFYYIFTIRLFPNKFIWSKWIFLRKNQPFWRAKKDFFEGWIRLEEIIHSSKKGECILLWLIWLKWTYHFSN